MSQHISQLELAYIVFGSNANKLDVLPMQKIDNFMKLFNTVGIVHQPTWNKSCHGQNLRHRVTRVFRWSHLLLRSTIKLWLPDVAACRRHHEPSIQSADGNLHHRLPSSYCAYPATTLESRVAQYRRTLTIFIKHRCLYWASTTQQSELKSPQKDPDFNTPEIECKLRIKNKLMRKGRTEEAGRMAEQIGKVSK